MNFFIVFLKQLFEVVNSEILNPFIANVGMIEPKFIFSEKGDKRFDSLLVGVCLSAICVLEGLNLFRRKVFVVFIFFGSHIDI